MGKVYFCIGDIHGMYDQLVELLNKIDQDVKENNIEDYEIISLGDLIDRGPKSKDVVQLIMDREITTLKGNHEDLACRGSNDSYNTWLANGGRYTLASYPNNEIFPEHLKFLDGLPIYKMTPEGFLFVHGGIHLGENLQNQDDLTMMWIRNWYKIFGNFKYNEFWNNKKIIHGHTPMDGAPVKRKILEREDSPIAYNLDAGCFYSGILCCGIFEEGKSDRFLQVIGEPSPQFKGY